LVKGFKLPHPIDYYIDIFCSGFSLVTRGTIGEKNYFIDLLMGEYVNFLQEAIQSNDDRNYKKRYVGKISF
jgi:hypothetical protein